MIAGANVSDYRLMLTALLPAGDAFAREADTVLGRLLDGWAAELARVHGRVVDLAAEADPRTARELLAEWETVCGLPDPCSAGIADTLQERRAAVVAKLTARGGQSAAYFLALAEALGYDGTTIAEVRPFVAGTSACGEGHQLSPPEGRHQWHVAVPGPRVTEFRAGASECGDRLGKIARAEDLECRVRRLKPGHTDVFFSYEGA